MTFPLESRESKYTKFRNKLRKAASFEKTALLSYKKNKIDNLFYSAPSITSSVHAKVTEYRLLELISSIYAYVITSAPKDTIRIYNDSIRQ